MLLWLLMNTALPLLPISLFAILSHLLAWKKSVLIVLADGQLYYFSATLCGLFLFDALRKGGADPVIFASSIVIMMLLMGIFTASLIVTHTLPPGHVPGTGDVTSRKLAILSIAAAVMTVGGITYARSALDLL